MKKSDWLIAVLCLAILIGAGSLVRKNLQLKKQKGVLKRDLKGVVGYTMRLSEWNGQVFSLPGGITGPDGKPFSVGDVGNPLAVVIVIGKMNCHACIDAFLGALTRIPKKSEIFRVIYPVSTKEDAERLEKNFRFHVPYYYGESLSWIEESEIVVGPSAFVIETETGKILASYLGNDVRSVNTTTLFIDYLVRLFGE
jgi:hypothetical protein